MSLYSTLVRSHLEYCICSPQHRDNIDLLEQVQKRATKIIQVVKHLSFEDRIRDLGLVSLEEDPGTP